MSTKLLIIKGIFFPLLTIYILKDHTNYAHYFAKQFGFNLAHTMYLYEKEPILKILKDEVLIIKRKMIGCLLHSKKTKILKRIHHCLLSQLATAQGFLLLQGGRRVTAP